MIVAYSNYDDTTNALECIAKTFVLMAAAAVTHNLGRADSKMIQTVLGDSQTQGMSLLFFGHGRSTPPSLEAHDQVSAIDASTCHLLSDRLVYAIGCHSAAGIATFAATHGATVIGYDDSLYVPLAMPYRFHMETCVLIGLALLLQGGTAGDAHAATKGEYRATARRLLASKNRTDQAFAVFFTFNADAHQLVGDPSSVL